MPKKDLIKKLQKACRRSQIAMTFTGLFISAFAIFMMWLGITGSDPSAGILTNIFVTALGAFFLLVGLAVLYIGIRPNPVVDMVKNHPEKIEKIYLQEAFYKVKANKVKNIIFQVTGGKRFPINGKPEQMDSIYADLKKELTNTKFGE